MKWSSISSVFISLLLSFSARSQEVIDEDFIDILNKNARELLADTDPDFTTTTIPEKWMNESSVTIGYKKHILFDKKRSGLLGGKENLVVLEKKRMKIKLIDKKAVDNFSELYFRYSSRFDGFGAVIYKDDGTRKEIPLTRAVSIEDNDNVPEFFKSFFDQNISNRHEYYKVPVADLLPGDVLEFVSQTSSTLNVKRTPYYPFDPQYELCQKGMPLITHKIIIETDNNSFITARSVNGAPEFQQASNGDFNVYTWVDRNRDRLKDVAFVNEYMVLPSVKFQITYTDGREFKALFAGSKGQITSSFDVADIGKRAFANYSAVGGSYVYGASGATVDLVATGLWTKMKGNGAKEATEDDFIRMAYYYIRHTQVVSNFYYTDKQFCYLLGQLLYNRKIPSDIIVTTPNNLTTPANLLFESELNWCLRVKNKFIFRATEHSNLYDVDEDMAGNEAYKLPTSNRDQTEKLQIPDIRMEDNKSLFQYFVTVDTSQKWLNVERTTAYSGIPKEKNSYSAMRYTTYMFNDTRTFNGPDDFENIPEKYASQAAAQKKAITDEFKVRKPEYMKELAEKDLGVSVRYTSFDISNDGRGYRKPELMYREKFQVGEKIRKAGKKLLVNLTGLMGDQLQMRKEERSREYDIDVRYPRKLRWQINLTIPEGYTAEGMEALNVNVDNETGALISTAAVKDNVLTIDIQKIYKQKAVSKAKWPLMLEFIDAAYNLSHRLILLRPVK